MITLLRCIKMNYVILLHKCSNDSQFAMKIFNFGQVFERWPHLIRGNFLVPYSLAFRLNTYIYRLLNVRSFKYRTENVNESKKKKNLFFFLVDVIIDFKKYIPTGSCSIDWFFVLNSSTLNDIIRYKIVLDTDAEQFGGHKRLDGTCNFFSQNNPYDGRGNSLMVSMLTLLLPFPGWRENINLHFYFHTSLCFPERFQFSDMYVVTKAKQPNVTVNNGKIHCDIKINFLHLFKCKINTAGLAPTDFFQ